MANTIKLKRGTSTPSTSDISNGEVAIDTSAKKLYINDSGTVKEIGGSGSVGGASGLDFNDNVKVRFGTGNDLEIFHDGSHSWLKNNTGYLRLAAGGSGVTISNEDNTEAIAQLVKNGSVDLYYDNSKKFETTSTGTKITGKSEIDGDVQWNGSDDTWGAYWDKSVNIVSIKDGAKIGFGTSNDLQIYHDGSHSNINSSTGNLRLQTDAFRVNSQDNNESIIRADKDGTVELYYDNSKKFETKNWGVSVTGSYNGTSHIRTVSDSGKITAGASNDLEIFHDGTWNHISAANNHPFKINAGTGNSYLQGQAVYLSAANDAERYLDGIKDGAVNLYYDNSKKLNTHTDGVEILGKLYMADSKNIELGSGQDLKIYHDGTDNYWETSSGTTHFRVASGNRISIDGTSGDVSMQGSSGKNFLWDVSAAYLNLNDNAKATYGTGDDLQIYHDATDSIIRNTTGDLYIQNSASDIEIAAEDNVYIKNYDGQTYARFIEDGASELYYDDVKTFQTDGNGIAVYGPEGGSANIYLYADEGDDNADKLRLQQSSTGDFWIENYASGSWEAHLKASNNGAVELYYDNSKKLETTSVGMRLSGNYQANDGYHIYLGTGNDLDIYHDGSNSVINNDTGDLYIKSADDIFLRVAGDESGINIIGDGAVELYYDNTKQFETAPSGLLGADNHRLMLGSDSDLQLWHDGTNSIIDATHGSGTFYIRGDALALQTSQSTPETYLLANSNSSVELYYDNVKTFETTINGVTVKGSEGNSAFLYVSADEGDDNADKWRHLATVGGQYFLSNYASGGWEHNIGFTGNGSAELYYDGTKKLETGSYGAAVTGYLQVGLGGGTNGLLANDDVKLRLGTDQDLEIYHNGTNSYLDNNTGHLVLRTNVASDVGGDVYLKPHDNENGLIVIHDSGVELYYNNSKKAETTSSGFDVTGTLTTSVLTTDGTVTFSSTSNNVNFTGSSSHAVWLPGSNAFRFNDNTKALFGTGNDFEIYHDGSNSVVRESGTGQLQLESNTNIVLGTQGIGETYLKAVPNGTVELYFNNSKKLETTSTGVEVTGIVDADAFIATADTGYKYSTLTSPSDTNIPYNTWTTISTNYGWSLPSAGTYLLTSSMRVRMWDVTGYIQCRLYDNTNSSAISDSIRMMWEQQSDTLKINVQITLQWVHTCTGAVTIYQQFNTTENSSATSIQNDNNGRNNVYWQRIG